MIKPNREIISRLCAGAAVLAAAYLLKRFYSQADSGDLKWIIGPTARLTECISDLAFAYEPGYGWVDVRHQVVIAPVCAGVNFLITALCMSSFQLIWKTAKPAKLLAGLGIAAGSAYALTVITNAMRIKLAVALFEPPLDAGWLTPDMLHRIAGTAVYYTVLSLYFCMVDYCLTEQPSAHPLLLTMPLFWYLLLSLGVPFANHAFANNPEQFISHALSVGPVALILTLIFIKIRIGLTRLGK